MFTRIRRKHPQQLPLQINSQTTENNENVTRGRYSNVEAMGSILEGGIVEETLLCEYITGRTVSLREI